MATRWGNVSCRQRVVEASYEWTLEYFGSLIEESKKDSCFFWSPAFVFSSRKFRLHIKSTRSFANGKRDVWIGLFLVFRDTQPPINVQYTFGIKTASGDTEVLASGTDTLPSIRNEYPNRCGSYKLIKASELRLRREQLLPLNALTLTISMKISPHTDRETAEATTQTSVDDTGVPEAVRGCQDPEYTDFAALGQNIEVLEGKDCDVSLEVGDKKFLVHKLILEARAPKLAAVISEQEAESETSDLCLKNHDPEAFQVFLRCVYAGAWENLNEKNVCKVYDIADKYDFLELKEACIRHMLSNLSPDSVCSVIDLADKHGEDLLMEKATDFVVANVRLVFKTDAWRKFEANSSLIAYHIYNRVYKTGK